MGQITSSEKKGFISPYKNLGEDIKSSTKPTNFGTFAVPQPKKIEKNGGWTVNPQLVDTRVGADIRKIQGESANIDAFGVENVRKLRQMGFNPDQINTYIKALSFNADNISETIQKDHQEVISENPQIISNEKGYTAKLDTQEIKVTAPIEKSTEKDINAKSFSQWSVKHHMKIIQRSNNSASPMITPATPEEIAEDKVTKILRSIVGAKRLGMKTRNISTVSSSDETLETLPILKDNQSISPEVTVAPLPESQTPSSDEKILGVNNEAITTPTIETIVGQSISSENVMRVTKPEPKIVPSSNFMKRLGMSSETIEEETPTDTNQVIETVSTETNNTKLETVEEKGDETILESSKLPESHTTALEQAYKKKRDAVAMLMAALEKNRVELWNKPSSEMWIGLSQPTINMSNIPQVQSIPQTLETKPIKNWRDSSALTPEASLVLADLVTP